MKKLAQNLLTLILTVVSYGVTAQNYEVAISPIAIEVLGGLQSYAIGTHDGEWLIVGGRLDGLHQRQPFAAFDQDGKNQNLIVVDPSERKVWRAPLTALPITIADQLSSSNMQYHQTDSLLLCTGGYAWSASADDHITFPYLTIVDIPATIRSIKNGSVNSTTFHQIENELFRVTGGALNQIDDTYYLVGGHTFMGSYNPMGPDQGPGFEQAYTDEIRKFKISKNVNYTVQILLSAHDEMHLHRRDYNLIPFLQDDERKLMAYSGVFKNSVDLPWLYPVSISSAGHAPVDHFTQYYNHYSCAHLAIYDEEDQSTRTIFFGGIAQFYEEDGILVQDNDVPFVNTISEVSTAANGQMAEIKLDIEMPGFLGAGSVFVPSHDLLLVDDQILDGSQIADEWIDVGYIYGGIRSTMPNIFWVNSGGESHASQTIYKVSIRKNNKDTDVRRSTDQLPFLHYYPNPENQTVRIIMDVERPVDHILTIADTSGNVVHTQVFAASQFTSGRNILTATDAKVGYGPFVYTMKSDGTLIERKVVWSE